MAVVLSKQKIHNKGHAERKCRRKVKASGSASSQHKMDGAVDEEEDDEIFNIYSLHRDNKTLIMLDVLICNTALSMELDLVASVSVISEETLAELHKKGLTVSLQSTKISLQTFWDS